MDWCLPAFMAVTGAHYLPFSPLYGMRVFIPLGGWPALRAGCGADRAVVGAVSTGVALLGVG